MTNTTSDERNTYGVKTDRTYVHPKGFPVRVVGIVYNMNTRRMEAVCVNEREGVVLENNPACSELK